MGTVTTIVIRVSSTAALPLALMQLLLTLWKVIHIRGRSRSLWRGWGIYSHLCKTVAALQGLGTSSPRKKKWRKFWRKKLHLVAYEAYVKHESKGSFWGGLLQNTYHSLQSCTVWLHYILAAPSQSYIYGSVNDLHDSIIPCACADYLTKVISLGARVDCLYRFLD